MADERSSVMERYERGEERKDRDVKLAWVEKKTWKHRFFGWLATKEDVRRATMLLEIESKNMGSLFDKIADLQNQVISLQTMVNAIGEGVTALVLSQAQESKRKVIKRKKK